MRGSIPFSSLRTRLPLLTLRTLSNVYVAAVSIVFMATLGACHLIQVCVAVTRLTDEFDCLLTVDVDMSRFRAFHITNLTAGIWAFASSLRLQP